MNTLIFTFIAFAAGTISALSAAWIFERIKLLRALRIKSHTQTVDRSGRVKVGFLSNISHEIRTPMNAILGMTNQLTETPLNPEQKEILNVLKRASESLLLIISDIIDISQISAGHLKIENTPYDLKKTLDDLVVHFTPQAFSKGLKLEFEFDSVAGHRFYGDAPRIRQIMANLLSNALKFTNQGRVRIAVGPNFDPTKKGNLLFLVSDTGVGIPREQQNIIFEAFQQGDDSVTKKFGGTGLGLAICKKLVEMMGGQIWLQSDENRGTAISFTIVCKPIATDNESKSPAVSSPSSIKPLNILLVDDYEDNRILMTSYLKKLPHKITQAENGQEAVDKAKSNHYDLILMDMQMPVLDGYSATKAIRDYEKANNAPRAYIVAHTAYALKAELERTLVAGCDEYMTKPVAKQTVIELLEKIAKTISQKAA